MAVFIVWCVAITTSALAGFYAELAYRTRHRPRAFELYSQASGIFTAVAATLTIGLVTGW